jgi:hypothetical protein
MQVRFLPGACSGYGSEIAGAGACYGQRLLVSESTLEAPAIDSQPPVTAAASSPPEPWTLRLFMRRHPWWTTALVVTLFSTVLVLWARTRPGFDPYGWLVWGHQTLTGSLDTNAAPSWKPLPYLLTVPFALAGHYQVYLWLIASVAVSLGGVVFAARIAYRLTDAPPERRYAAVAAGAFAGVALLGIQDYSHYVLSAQSDPMIVSLCLAAIDCHLSRRPRWAFVLGVLAALGRPEVWPFLGLYSLWAWRTIRSMRWMIGSGVVLIVLLWFGIPALTSRSPFVAATNALGSGRRLHDNKVLGTISRFLGMHEAPVEVAALVAVALAAYRRERTTLMLAGAILAWVIVEIAFALHGWPGLVRYMFEAGGVTVVLAGVAVGKLLSDPPRPRGIPSWAGPVLVVALVISLVPTAISRARVEHKDLKEQRARTAELNRLIGVIRGLGGAAALRPCGEPLTRLEYQTALAWSLKDNVSRVGFKYGQAIQRGDPIVLFTPESTGWKVQAVHQVMPQCRTLPH